MVKAAKIITTVTSVTMVNFKENDIVDFELSEEQGEVKVLLQYEEEGYEGDDEADECPLVVDDKDGILIIKDKKLGVEVEIETINEERAKRRQSVRKAGRTSEHTRVRCRQSNRAKTRANVRQSLCVRCKPCSRAVGRGQAKQAICSRCKAEKVYDIYSDNVF